MARTFKRRNTKDNVFDGYGKSKTNFKKNRQKTKNKIREIIDFEDERLDDLYEEEEY